MLQSTITEKGQTTIPVEIRKAYGLTAGSLLMYAPTEDGILIRKHPGLMSLSGALAGRVPAHLKGKSMDEIRALAAKKALEDKRYAKPAG